MQSPAFAAIATALHIPITLLLIGIVLRGTAFTFRTYDVQRDDVQRRWSIVFSIASIVTPILLGTTLGAIASGPVRVENGAVTSGSFVHGWLRFLWPLVSLRSLCSHFWRLFT